MVNKFKLKLSRDGKKNRRKRRLAFRIFDFWLRLADLLMCSESFVVVNEVSVLVAILVQLSFDVILKLADGDRALLWKDGAAHWRGEHKARADEQQLQAECLRQARLNLRILLLEIVHGDWCKYLRTSSSC